jgi:cellulose synthase/poly-beta-1,6-N-acetylglucosamine synthase-like glycosyltransferase
LVEQIAELDGKCSYQVIFVGDGYKQMSLSAKMLFKDLFTSSSNDNDVYEWEGLMEKMQSQIQETHTYVIQRVFQFDENYYKRSLIKLKEKQIYLSLVLKTNNRRKHNSQEWILNAFATQAVKIDSDSRHYIFMSDCGTLYVKMLSVLYSLITKF